MKKALLLIFVLLVLCILPLSAVDGEQQEAQPEQKTSIPIDPEPYNIKAAAEAAKGKTPSGFEYELYSEEEFSPGLMKLRRAETLFFGGIPLTFAMTGVVNALIGMVTGNRLEFWPVLGISAAASAVISLIDYILGERGT